MKVFWRMSLVGTVGLATLCGGIGGQTRPVAAAVAVEASEQANVDALITAVIKAKLESDRLLRHAVVTIATKDGVVTLSGSVPTDFAHAKAMAAARGTPGVVMIDDQLRLDVSSPNAPSQD
jgi:hyperosmotically inducible protein